MEVTSKLLFSCGYKEIERQVALDGLITELAYSILLLEASGKKQGMHLEMDLQLVPGREDDETP